MKKALASMPILLLTIALASPGCKSPAAKAAEGRAEDQFQAGSNRPPSSETLYAMARIVRTQGKDSVQDFLLRKIIEENPGFLPAYNDLAELQIRRNRIDEAQETVEVGLRHGRGDPVLTNNLGMCWLLKGERERALALFVRAAGKAPEDTRFRANMAVALGLLGRYDESLNLYLQLVPEWDAHHNLAVLCESRKDYLRAAEESRKEDEIKKKYFLISK